MNRKALGRGLRSILPDAPGKCVDGGIPACKAIQPGTHGACEMVLGWIFDGRQCVLESGCGCGQDCAAIFASAEACRLACL